MPPAPPVKLMNLTELKKLAKGYDDLMSIKTKGMTRDQLITAIEGMGYTIDHKKKTLRLTNKGKAMKRKPLNVKLPPPPKPLTQQQKTEKKEKSVATKKKDVVEYIQKNKNVLNDPKIKPLHSGKDLSSSDKRKMVIDYILNNKEVLNDSKIKHLHKGLN